jgi:aromatic ring-opening dioxygenase LigB subunit
MSLVFSCISAHTPVLLPNVSKNNISIIAATKAAVEKLEQELYVAQPDTIIVISPHGDALPDAITVNMCSKYRSNFEEFGDLTTKLEWKPNTMLIDRIREDFKEKHLPLVLDSKDKLDYGTAVPLSYLTKHLPDVKVVPIITSQLDLKTHYELGKQLKDEIMSSTSRIAVIASADLSHRVGENSPAGFSAKGVAFDDAIQTMLKEKNPTGILDIDADMISEAQACGAAVLAVLFGVLDDVHHQIEVISYEKPLGVGYLVASMKIS